MGKITLSLVAFHLSFFESVSYKTFFLFLGWGGGFCCVCTAAPQPITCRRGPVAQTREYNGVKQVLTNCSNKTHFLLKKTIKYIMLNSVII